MKGQWTSVKLPNHKDIGTPEAHWAKTVLNADVEQAFMVYLSKQKAEQLEKELRKIGESARNFISVLDRGRLQEFIAKSTESSDHIEVELFQQGSNSANSDDLFGLGLEDVLQVAPAPEVQRNKAAGQSATPPVYSRIILPASAVVTVVIDDGLGIANERFRDAENSTRVLYFLDMNTHRKSKSPSANLPTPTLEGSTWTKEAIDQILSTTSCEEQIYRAMGLIDPQRIDRETDAVGNLYKRDIQPLRYQRTHGSHVLDLATGIDPKTHVGELAKTHPIIAIQLPDEAVLDRSGTHLSQVLCRALKWLRARMLEILVESERGPKPAPLVVNFSFGVVAGPHDGQSIIERVISEFVAQHRELGADCKFVIAAGNGLQSRSHAVLDLAPASSNGAGSRSKASHTLKWRVQPDDQTSSFLQIWLPPIEEKLMRVSVQVKPPRLHGAIKIPKTKLGRMYDWKDADNNTIARIYHQEVLQANGKRRERITICIRSTSNADLGMLLAPHGIWEVLVHNQSDGPLKLNARIQRDDAGPGVLRRGRQSYFDNDNYVLFEQPSGRLRNDERKDVGPITRQGTMNAYAAAQGALSVAGYVLSNCEPAIYSASGNTIADLPGPNGPTCTAVSEISPGHPGVLASGTRTGMTTIMGGTSVAAPQFTRYLAEEIAGVSGTTIHSDCSGVPGRKSRTGNGFLGYTERRPKAKRIDE